MENNQLGQIYCLKHPVTETIFYIGATTKPLITRLNIHYWHLAAVQRGDRLSNKRFEYLQNLLPLKAIIANLETVPLELLDEKEKEYIEKYKSLYDLTNTTIGGKGGDTYTNNSEERKKEISEKISNANKGKPKPIGFSENLSSTRKGKGNPNVKELTDWIVMDGTKLFKYGFEINDYIGKKDAYMNVKRSLTKINSKPYKHTWRLFSSLNIELQDIVQFNYESN